METYSMPSSSPRAELSYLPLHHLQSVPADSKLMSTHREMFCHSTNSLQRNSLISSGEELEIKSNGAAFNSAGDHSGVSSEKHWVKLGTGPDTDRHRDGNKVLAEMQGGDDGDEEDEEGKYGASGGKKKGEKKVRRPRFAFHTRSQVDILDDGYRWRKYGQKAVKNNNFPRSYYRCTHQGCSVKKQVQRLSKDEEVVVTTYEGTHTHPIERNTDNFEQILNQMQIYTRF